MNYKQHFAFEWWHALSEKKQLELTIEFCKKHNLTSREFEMKHIIQCRDEQINQPL